MQTMIQNLPWYPSRRQHRKALTAATVMAVLVLLYALAGCASSPRERYNTAAGVYNVTALGLATSNEVKPFPPALWTRLKEDLSVVRMDLVEAKAWLDANPAVADVPGAPFPILDTAKPLLSLLRLRLASFSGVELLPTSPKPFDPPEPTTAGDEVRQLMEMFDPQG